ncbi:hypothetical protein QAD02_010884 [Eretmocerus hayati]|uniref:Uncharacterized protein n=1 Tax=Eretmocerus hayati TaxID=131215 RepID=A0ACC2NV67_9HYME|nr:hypothetical protein QAD02_010884 [Eretmocerus hayati]
MGATAKPAPPSTDIKSQQQQQQQQTPNGAQTWGTMTHRQKLSHVFGNITVEPMVGLYIMPSVLASLATQNLNLEKSCKVNLAYPASVCDALAARNTTGLEIEETRVQQLVAGMQIWKTALQSFFPSILILFLGAWSDRTGLRKPCMLLPICGEFLTSISLIVCTYFFYELPMEYAGFSESFWPSITGGWFTMIMGTFSYIGDITSVESRTLRIGCLNAFLSLGVPIGMALSGILYVQLGFYGVFGISAACYVVAFTYGLLVVKEAPRAIRTQNDLSSGKNNVPESGVADSTGGDTSTVTKMSFSLTDFFAPRHVRETFRVVFKNGPRNRRKRIVVLMLITIVLMGPMYGEFQSPWY